MLLIKVTACLMYREHAVFKSVYADETIAHEWNCTDMSHAKNELRPGWDKRWQATRNTVGSSFFSGRG